MNVISESAQLEVPEAPLDPLDDLAWAGVAQLWQPRPDTTYLNHGSFGLSPSPVRQFQRRMTERLQEQPMDFYVRQLEPLINDARKQSASFFGTSPANFVFVENATSGMNVVANSFSLQAGDEILLNDHEYGAVHRIWERAAERAKAKCVSVDLPERIESKVQIVDSLLAAANERTKLVVISHITSPTAIIFPIQEVVAEFKKRGIAVCVDGPHALLQLELNLDELGCDFYTASCHKWLTAPLGSGFCFAHPRWHAQMQPPMKSWGRLLPAIPHTWDEEFTWPGTRDPSAYLSVPIAIKIMQKLGLGIVRRRMFGLANYARERLVEWSGQLPIAPREFYGTMAQVPLPPDSNASYQDLQSRLWSKYAIEVPIIEFNDKWYIRVSTHIYNRHDQVDKLLDALKTELN